jgi:hypothetical protein
MRQLISKLIAAAISAAVVLLWWPIIMSTDGPTSWALRAVAWTLLFESVLALLAPIEESIWDRHIASRRVVAQMSNARQRVYAHDAASPKRIASRAAVVALVAAIPLGLIASGPSPVKPNPTVVKRPSTTKIIRITKVIRVNTGAGYSPPTETVGESHRTVTYRTTTPKRTSGKHTTPKAQSTPKPEPTTPVAEPQQGSVPVAATPPATG